MRKLWKKFTAQIFALSERLVKLKVYVPKNFIRKTCVQTYAESGKNGKTIYTKQFRSIKNTYNVTWNQEKG